MWWKWVLKAAVAVGLDQWAKRKAEELLAKLKDKITHKADQITEAVPTAVVPGPVARLMSGS